MKKNKTYPKWFFYLLCVGVGLINGFFGGGGGMLCVPLIEKGLNVPSKKAHATTIAVILPLSIVSSVVYIMNNTIDIFKLSIITLGVVLGGILGAFLLKKLNNNFIKIIFAIVMLLAGIKMVL